jgi:hypothetical protein
MLVKYVSIDGIPQTFVFFRFVDIIVITVKNIPSVFMYAMNIQNDVIGLVLRENCKSKQVIDFIAWPRRCHGRILQSLSSVHSSLDAVKNTGKLCLKIWFSWKVFLNGDKTNYSNYCENKLLCKLMLILIMGCLSLIQDGFCFLFII